MTRGRHPVHHVARGGAVVWATAAGMLLGLLAVFSIPGMVAAQSQIVNVTSNVSIYAQLAIAASNNLSGGVVFGNITILPQTNLNATHVNDSNTTELPGIVGALNTSYYINVSRTSNVNVTLCFSANNSLKTPDGLNTIPLSGFTWNDSAFHGNGTWFGGGPPGTPLGYVAPSDSNQAVPNANYAIVTGATNMSQNGNTQNSTVLFRFWLDIPATQAPGDYFNTLSFKGVRDNAGCGSYP